MSLKEVVLQWDNMWRYDYWWRQKYRIPFNSEKHRAARQEDIAFEYMESRLADEALEELKKEEEREKLKKSGQWMKSNVDPEKQKELFEKVDWSSFK